MRIEFLDKGAVGHIVITSPFCITWRNEGFWVKRTILSGPIVPMLRAHKAAWREVNR